MVHSEARVVGVIADGYRCPDPQLVSESGAAVALTPALDDEDRRDSCRPVGAKAAEAPRYLAAWQSLHPRVDSHAQRVQNREALERVLEARSVFGFGANCTGPVVDLALSPDGQHVAWMLAEGNAASVQIRSTAAPSARSLPVSVSQARAGRRLAWTSQSEALLWEPAGESSARCRRRGSRRRAAFGTEVVWREGRTAPPAAPASTALPLARCRSSPRTCATRVTRAGSGAPSASRASSTRRPVWRASACASAPARRSSLCEVQASRRPARACDTDTGKEQARRAVLRI